MNVLQLGFFTGTTIVSSTIEHITNRKSFKNTPHAEFSYHQGFSLIKGFLEFARGMTVEDLQGLTSQPLAVPAGSRKEDVYISDKFLEEAAKVIEADLGEEGIKLVGGTNWWRWREEKLHAEWIETSKHYDLRKKGVIEETALLYIHGGAFFFGSAATMRFQSLALAKKIGTKVLSVNYRLSPQYPFPCALQDVFATYMHLLEAHSPTNILIAGDSAGGNLSLALMVVLRNQGLPLPAGGILLSPWVDLTHSFPSCAAETPSDYIPHTGFQNKPSMAWPPPAVMDESGDEGVSIDAATKGEKDAAGETRQEASASPSALPKSIRIKTKDGKEVELKEQIHMYATNELVEHPLISLVNEPSLGGLPPILITTGGAEKLHDEHLYLAHKMANPQKYPANEETLKRYPSRAQYADKYPPTDVKLQSFEGCCHVVTTLSFTKPAKLSFRSIATFGKYALARANGREIEHSISSFKPKDKNMHSHGIFSVGEFEGHMIRERVTCKGEILPMEPESEIPALNIPRNKIGVINSDALQLWLEARHELEKKYANLRKTLQEKLNAENTMAVGDIEPGENPPPGALYRRRRRASAVRPSSSQSNMPSQLWNKAAESGTEEDGTNPPEASNNNGQSKL